MTYSVLVVHLRISLTIGLFGLIGMVGLAMSPIVGRFVDKLVPWYATLISTVALLVVYGVQTAAIGYHVAVVVFVTIGCDVFRQTQYVSVVSAVLALDPNARSRINAVLIFTVSASWAQ